MSSVSVVIPCYNYGRFLPDCVASALTSQPGVDVRVLIIDDASTDDSAQVAKQLAANHSNVEVIVHSVNAGHLGTYNEGLLNWADSDYSVLLSADDLLTPGALSRACALLDSNPSVGFCYGHPLWFTHPGPLPPARTECRGWTIWEGHQWLKRRFRSAQGCITSPEVVMRTSLLQRVGGFDLRLPHTGDLELWMRLAAHADVGYIRGTDQAYYRTHQENMHKSHDLFSDLTHRRMAYEVVLERCADTLSDRKQDFSDTVHRKLAWQALWYAARAYDRGRTDEVPVDKLVSFAGECWPRLSALTSFWGLRWRQMVGTKTRYLQPLILTAVARKAHEWWWWRSWRRNGILRISSASLAA